MAKNLAPVSLVHILHLQQDHSDRNTLNVIFAIFVAFLFKINKGKPSAMHQNSLIFGLGCSCEESKREGNTQLMRKMHFPCMHFLTLFMSPVWKNAGLDGSSFLCSRRVGFCSTSHMLTPAPVLYPSSLTVPACLPPPRVSLWRWRRSDRRAVPLHSC